MSYPECLGIDLGTTHTVCATTEQAAPPALRILKMPQAIGPGELAKRALLPSFLYAPLAGENALSPWDEPPFILGEYARHRGQELPSRLVASAKSWLSYAAADRTAPILPWSAESAVDDVVRISPVEASTRILRRVKQAYVAARPESDLESANIVLTVPASFDQAARGLTLRAARQAGLSVRLLEEPQAAFYDYLFQAGEDGLLSLLADADNALVLVCDVGGGTTDLTLIRIERTSSGKIELTRLAVGRHLLLGGDNIDLALAHLCERRLAAGSSQLDATQFAQLTLACRAAKEQLLAGSAPDAVQVRILGRGAALVGNTLATEIGRKEVEQVALEGFLPLVAREAEPQRSRAALMSFGLPYEQDPAITRHIASFLRRHAPKGQIPDAVLLNGGLFRSERASERILELLSNFRDRPVKRIGGIDPELSVARGAVAYALSLSGHGLRIGGGSAHGYYVGVESTTAHRGEAPRAVCVVPRGAKEGERHLAEGTRLSLTVGRPVRFELYASDTALDAPGNIVGIDDERFEALPPMATLLDSESDSDSGLAPEAARRLPVMLEGELSPVGTLDLACVQLDTEQSRRFELAFELRGQEGPGRGRPGGHKDSRRAFSTANKPKSSVRALGQRFEHANEAIQRVFGKGRADVKPRESKDLLRELERLLGARQKWDGELTRALFDIVGPKHKARRRSADHERMYWMLSGFCLRPGFGHPLDPQRIRLLAPLFHQGLSFGQEKRQWEQFFIAWRRIAGGLSEPQQTSMRDLCDPFLLSHKANLKKPKGFKPQAIDEMLNMASFLERVPTKRRAELGNAVIEQTWTNRDPRLWEVLGRLGARLPIYASVHHVVPPAVVSDWLDHLLREKWETIPTAARAAWQMARVTSDRTRDLPESERFSIALRLEQIGAPPAWIAGVREFVPAERKEQAESFGEELPAGLSLLETEGDDTGNK